MSVIEAAEQARLLSMSAEREAWLSAKLAKCEHALKQAHGVAQACELRAERLERARKD